jgi:hypothetical protein
MGTAGAKVTVASKLPSVRDKAKDGKDVDSGLGPLTPDAGDRRMPKKLLGGAQGRTSPESEPDLE